MSKLKAVALHFSISFLVVASVLAVVFTQWYPAPYFTINGAQPVIMTLIGVDLVLGPLLTAIVYRAGKKSLKFDMSVIAAVQLVALAYGAGILFQERPQYMVFAVDRFAVLPARDLLLDSEAEIDACAGVSSTPCVVVARLPQDPKERETILLSALESGVDIERLPQYWVGLEEGVDSVLARSQPLSRLTSFSDELAGDVRNLLDRHDKSEAQMRYLPVVNKRLQSMILIVDAQTAEAIDVIDHDPWVLDRAPAQDDDLVDAAG